MPMYSNKGSYLKIKPDIRGGGEDYIIETGGEFDSFCIAVTWTDILKTKAEIERLENDRKLRDEF